MLFSVFTLDNPDALDKRKAVHGAHVAHLKRAKDYGVTITVGVVRRWRHLDRQLNGPRDTGPRRRGKI